MGKQITVSGSPFFEQDGQKRNPLMCYTKCKSAAAYPPSTTPNSALLSPCGLLRGSGALFRSTASAGSGAPFRCWTTSRLGHHVLSALSRDLVRECPFTACCGLEAEYLLSTISEGAHCDVVFKRARNGKFVVGIYRGFLLVNSLLVSIQTGNGASQKSSACPV